MLVLSRRVGETIVIDDEIVLTVIQVDGQKVRLGIQAPPSIKVWRAELLEAREKPAAATPPSTPARPNARRTG